MENAINGIIENFEDNIKSVYRLMNFDEEVVVFCIERLEKVDSFLKKHRMDNHTSCSVKQILNQLKKIKKHESLADRYSIMLNQCVVLLVSYFASAIHDIFSIGLTYKIKKGREVKILDKDGVKLGTKELYELYFESFNTIGDLIANKKQMSFQDTQSIADAFNDYLDYKPIKDKNVNNIILALACRHAFVHSSGIVNKKTINQISNAKPRDIKKKLNENDKIQFEPDEIKQIGKSMLAYVNGLAKGVTDKLNI